MFESVREAAHTAQQTLLQVAGAGLLEAESVVRVRQDFERYDETARELQQRYPDDAEQFLAEGGSALGMKEPRAFAEHSLQGSDRRGHSTVKRSRREARV